MNTDADNTLYVDLEKDTYNKSYQEGYDDGLKDAKNRCFEKGFREGVQVYNSY